jgi:Zn-dependent M28 family amino/carboxypeptidase
LLSTAFMLATAGPSLAIDPIDTSELVKAVTVEKIGDHLEQLQALAANHDNTRALGSKGYDASVRYVVNRLVDAGIGVQIQPFTANLFEENSEPRLIRTNPGREVYDAGQDFLTMTYSGAGDVTAPLALARRIQIPPSEEPSSQSGCRPEDFPSSVSGKIVLVQRGTCTFFEKANFARRAGAVGVIIFNEGQPGRREVVSGTLGEELPIPVVGATFQLGRNLYNRVRDGQNVRLRLAVDAETTPVDTFNVIGEIPGRRNDWAVVVGAHLDSVPEGPGINDNGSGTATILTIAEQMQALGIEPRNTVRFAFWGAEEEGLFGSTHYVNNLGAKALAKIGLNLNFDMLGSTYFVRFVYDGDGTLGDAGPPGSDEIEAVFQDFFRSRDQASDPTPFDGRSDYLAFIQAGIPAGGLFSGAEGIKTDREERRYGGTAGRPYDPCYHEACDDISNISGRSLRDLGKAAAHAVLSFAQTPEDIRTRDRAKIAAARARALQAEYRGPHLVR